jgi:rhamnopyranosyl-N-acetylglucosaminyl-diphospho-decaprenol beta-1,3/1,4-galactofuranosyltransferase
MQVAAVIITYNRRDLLMKCLHSVLQQSRPVDAVVLVDNGSVDGTSDALQQEGYFGNDRLHYVRLEENIGSAGGFFTGFKYAYEQGYDWLWTMDDDAEPENHCLENLVCAGLDENYVYGAMPVDPSTGQLCWPIPLANTEGSKGRVIGDLNEIPSRVFEVSTAGFLGTMFPRRVVGAAGYPNPDLFIRGEEGEYSLRLRKAGFRFLILKDAVIYHPAPRRLRTITLLNRNIFHLYSEPWKAYYATRNSIFTAVYVKRDLKVAILRSLYVLGMLYFEDQKLKRLPLYIRAIKDGFGGKLGNRITSH